MNGRKRTQTHTHTSWSDMSRGILQDSILDPHLFDSLINTDLKKKKTCNFTDNTLQSRGKNLSRIVLAYQG